MIVSQTLAEKVVVITGGGGVIGSAFARALASSHARVALLGRTKERVENVAAEIRALGGNALGVSANVLDRGSLELARKSIIVAWGSPDVLINCAGGNHPRGVTSREFFHPEDLKDNSITSFFDLDEESMASVFDLNFMGSLLPTQLFGKDMVGKSGASIINISSMSALTPLTKVPAYSAAKAAVTNFTKWLAVHMAKVNIRANAIAPGFFLTDQNRSLLTNEDGSFTPRAEKIVARTPSGRLGRPEELVGTLLWLIDERQSGFVNGAVIPVDGGFLAYAGV